MARVLPTRKFKIGSWEFSFNPGPFYMKEHVLISIFANCGSGTAYAVSIVTIIKAFYLRNISFVAGWILVVTTQVITHPNLIFCDYSTSIILFFYMHYITN